MNTQSNYYKLILSRLEKSTSSSQANSALDELPINDSVTSGYLTQNDSLASLSSINQNLNKSIKLNYIIGINFLSKSSLLYLVMR